MRIKDFHITEEEGHWVIDYFKNRYTPVYDRNGKIVDMVNMPTDDQMIKAIKKRRLELAL